MLPTKSYLVQWIANTVSSLRLEYTWKLHAQQALLLEAHTFLATVVTLKQLSHSFLVFSIKTSGDKMEQQFGHQMMASLEHIVFASLHQRMQGEMAAQQMM